MSVRLENFKAGAASMEIKTPADRQMARIARKLIKYGTFTGIGVGWSIAYSLGWSLPF